MHRILTLLARVASLAAGIAGVLTWLPPTLARLVVGTVFWQSGWGKLNDIDQVIEYFTELGLPMPAFQAHLAATAEFVCGGLLLLGLATRFAVVPLIITMAVAIRTALWDQVEGVSSLFTMVEFLYLVLCVWLGVSGPGPFALDALLARVGGQIGAAAPFMRRG